MTIGVTVTRWQAILLEIALTESPAKFSQQNLHSTLLIRSLAFKLRTGDSRPFAGMRIEIRRTENAAKIVKLRLCGWPIVRLADCVKAFIHFL